VVQARGGGHEIATKIVNQLTMKKTVLQFSTDNNEKFIQFMLYIALKIGRPKKNILFMVAENSLWHRHSAKPVFYITS
jgi:hypothetical protein